MPDRKAVQKEYDKLFKVKPNKWDNPDRSRFMIEILKQHIPNPKEVIDIGCGNGVALENYRRYNKTAKLYGIDPSLEGIRLAQQRVPDGIFTTEEYFEDIKKFELVICLGVAEHVEELPKFLQYLKSLVSDGGYCYFEVPHNLVYSKGPESYRRLTVGSRQIEWHFPSERWQELLLEAGFEIVERYKGLNATWEFIWLLK